MNTLSLLLTVGSLLLACGMALVVARVLRNERRRSDARVAVLAQMAEPDFLSEPDPVSIPDDTPDGSFVEPERSRAWGTRAVMVGGAALFVIVLLTATMFRSAPTEDPQGAALAEAASAPLALLALSHTQESGTLTVSGRVQNPREGQPRESLTATVFLFGADGAFLTSGRSPLDVQPLGAGDESAFVVAVPVNGVVRRLKVSFRDANGRPVAHADHRKAAALARNE